MFLASRVILQKPQAIGVFTTLDLAKNACESDYHERVGAGGIIYLIESFETDVYDPEAPTTLYDYIPNPSTGNWSQTIVERNPSIEI